MTTKDADRGAPGALMLAFARAIVDEPTFSTVVMPAVADFQRELHDAGGRTGRLVARARGYAAFSRLLIVLLVVPPVGSGAAHERRSAAGGNALVVLVALLMAATWPVFGWFTAFAALGGVAFAVTMRWWNNRHPALIIDVDPETGRRPEINLSRIPVGGNAGGLIFAVGSVVIVILGLPELRWFLLGAVLSGVCAAGALFAWRRSHPSGILPRNSIATR